METNEKPKIYKAKKENLVKERLLNSKMYKYYALYLVLLLLVWYFMLPTINLRTPGFYFFLALFLTLPVTIVLIILSAKNEGKKTKKKFKKIQFSRNSVNFVEVSEEEYYSGSSVFVKSIFYCFIGAIALVLLFGLTGLHIFNAKRFATQLPIEMKQATDLSTEFDYESGEVILPNIDKELAFKLAQAKLEEYGAQYSIDSQIFTIISVERGGKTELIRVTPLEYASDFVAISRMRKGTIGYIEVNVVTKEANLVKFDDNDGLKYMPSAILNYDLDRHIYFSYPTAMYSEKHFEIDNEGNPYWVIPTYKKEIGVFSGAIPSYVLIVNPINGEIKKYERGSEPEWTQRCVDESVVVTQANNALKYKNGYFNTLFAKKEVFNLSDGYNYINKNGETYYVSCITSPNENDQTSIGFIIINLKTKEAKRYIAPGITEMRAREIAMYDERVKAQQLEATWPILITYNNVPTYFVVLKNDVQAQKTVLINVNTGSYVAMEENLTKAITSYENLLFNAGTIEKQDKTANGTVTNIRDTGSTIEFMLDSVPDYYFSVSVDLSLTARFLQVGDIVEIEYKDNLTYGIITKITK